MDIRKTVLRILSALLMLGVIACLGGWIGQLLRNYEAWQAAGASLAPGAGPALPSFEPAALFRGLFSFPYGLYGLALACAAVAGGMLFLLRVGRDGQGDFDQERNLTYSENGTYGTAGFMTEAERKKVLDLKDVSHTKGVILGMQNGKVLSLPPDTRMNQNMIVYGATGSMKSRAFVRNRIFQAVVQGESLVITGSKSEIYNEMSDYLAAHGYIVKIFNLVDPEYSDSWACLAAMHGDDLMAQIFSEVIITNSSSGNGDRFWDSSEQNLLKALLLYVDNEYQPEQRTLAAVYDLLTSTQGQSLDAIGRHLPVGHPAKACFNVFLQSSETVRAGAVTGLAGRLQLLQNPSIREITSHDEIDLIRPGKEKCAYFCITSDQDSTFDFLSSLFFSFLFIKLVRFAEGDCPNGRLPVPVHVLGEELNNAGRIDALGRKMSVMRSRGLSISLVVQGLGQLQNRYPDNEWVEIIGNADTTLFLGCTDEVTAKFISDRAGEVTIAYSTDARVYSSMQLSRWTPQYRETHSVGKRKLLTVDEVLRLPLDKELIILRGQKVLLADKFDYTLHPHAQLLTPTSTKAHIPAWRAARTWPAPAPAPEKRPGPTAPVPTPKPEEPLQITDVNALFL